MNDKIKRTVAKTIVGGTAIAFALGLNYIYAWTAPALPPPNGNVTAPVNVGTIAQVKNGGLSVNDFTAFGNAYVQNNLGIGIATAGSKLHVVGNTYMNGGLGIGGATVFAPGAGIKLDVQGGAVKTTGGLIIETRTTDPASPVSGQMWLRTDL